MPLLPDNKKNSLQSVVDTIQSQISSSSKNQPTPGYIPNPQLKSLRTFQGDVQEHIETKKETIATIALAEQKKKIEHNEPTYTERPKRSFTAGILVIISIIFLAVGGVIIGGIYFFKTTTEPASPTTTENPLIAYTNKKDVVLPSITHEYLASALRSERASFTTEVDRILYTTFSYGTSSLTTAELIPLIAPNAGDALQRNITSVMMGVYSYDTNEVFFLLRPDDFGIVYSGMLNWESALGKDMADFFPTLQNHLTTNPSVFTDETYKNKDVRVIKDDRGNVVLLYGFINKDVLVITANERIFEALINQYNKSKLLR